MAVAILGSTGTYAVDAETWRQVRRQVGMGEIDAGVENRDTYAFSIEAGLMSIQIRSVFGSNALYSGGDGFRHGFQQHVGDDGPHPWIAGERLRLRLRTPKHETI
jgi:hypothetical protein